MLSSWANSTFLWVDLVGIRQRLIHFTSIHSHLPQAERGVSGVQQHGVHDPQRLYIVSYSSFSDIFVMPGGIVYISNTSPRKHNLTAYTKQNHQHPTSCCLLPMRTRILLPWSCFCWLVRIRILGIRLRKSQQLGYKKLFSHIKKFAN